MAATSQESREPCRISKVKVTILASEWGSSKGGLSTINRELAIQLAKCPLADITFFVPRCSEEDKHAALSHNIRILEATRRPGYEELDWLSFPPEHLQIDIIVGHGVKLGRQAQVIRDAKKCGWVQVAHTDPEELGMFKNYRNPISRGEEKHNVEVELCGMANFVVGIGPKLSEAFRRYLRWCKTDQTIFDLTPGIFAEFVSVEQVPDETKHRSILVFGRGDAEDFELKGFDIAGKAVAALPDTQLMFVGAPDGKQEKIAERFTRCGVPTSRLRVRGFVKNRENLKHLFCEVDLVLMPSRTEGFGLTGLEALSAGLPVLVSKNSGFGEALSTVAFGSSFVVNSEDPEVWAAAIRNILGKDRIDRLEEASALRDSYKKKYSWDKQINYLINLVFGIKFNRKPGAELAHLECQGDESGSVTALSSFLGDFQTRDVPVDKNSIEREKYVCPTSDIVEYIIKYCKEDLDSITKSLEEFDFHIPKYKGRTIYMSGRRKGLQQARIKLDELINSLVVCSIDGRHPGLQKYLEKGGKGEQWIEKVQHYHECLIQIENTFDQKQDSCYLVTAHGHTISWVIGDIVSQQVHTVVSLQGECTDAILRSCQEVHQFSGSLRAGEIVESPISNLPCRHVLLTDCSNWNEGNGEQCLRIIVQKSLRKVDELQGKSIAFPAIGTGKLQFPPTDAARIMLDETIKFCGENPNSNVKDVRFVLLHSNDLVIDAFAQEINHQQKTPRRSPVLQTSGKTWYEDVHIFQGDLTKESQTDAILNVITSDKNMTKAGSLSAAVVQAAGSGIEEEFRRLTRQTKRPSAVMTSGGKLKVPHIIHIIPSFSDKHAIKKSLIKGFFLAKQNGLRSISLPAVGTGWYGLSASDSASLIFKSLSKVWGSCTRFPNVHIVLLQSEFMSAFRIEKNKYISPKILQKKTWCEKVEIVYGDLTNEFQTDAIVNVIASDINTTRVGSLSAVVVSAAGSGVENEFRSHLRQSNQPAAVITSGGRLKVPYVIHIIPSSSGKQEIKKSLEEGLRQAKQRNMRSISLPAVGTRWYGLSAVDSASVIFKALSNVWGSYSFSSKVKIVILQPDLMPAFVKEKQKYLALLAIQGGSRRNTKKGQVKIEVVNGDLINENSDAIVNIINSDMNMDNAGELSRAIARVCGSGVKKECRQLGQQQGGSVVITSGGNLKVRHIIHLIPESSDIKHLQMCLTRCLQLADSKGLRSVSLPAIGTGEYRMSPAVAANMIFQALGSFSRSCAKILSIRIVIKQSSMVDAFRKEQKGREKSSSAAVSTKPTNQSVRVTVTGKNQESVDKAISELNKDFSESCLSDEVNDNGVCYLFENQIGMLIREAENCDVEMTVEAARGYITLSGNKDEVHSMTKRINEAISEARERKIEQQEAENAQMISNTIEWCYALQRDNIPFDDAANLELERAYTRGDEVVEVSSCGERFAIHVQENIGHTQNQQIAVTRKLKEEKGISLPEHWDQMFSDGNVFMQVPLNINSTEYYEVSQKFYATADGVFIRSIERIQNPWLYQTYMVSKKTMDKKTGGNSERLLFYGTAAVSISQINTNGFNRSHVGKHGTRYGRGIYFARDAKKSQSYTESSMRERYMYFVRVLVGRFCQGNDAMRIPPPINPANNAILYDSTVDKTINPEEFVIYRDTQCYPEYLITFE